MDWFRSYHGAPLNPRWLSVARAADVPPGVVSATWWALLDHASQQEPRGSVEEFDTETVALFYGWPEEQIQSVISAMESRGMIEGGLIVSWASRQPKREDDTASDRKRTQRDRMRVTHGHAPSRIVTQCHASSRDVTTEESRVDERRVEESRGEDNREEKNKTQEGGAQRATAPRPRFVKPTLDEVKAYCEERKNGIDPQAFIDHYESNGWRVGQNAMKDWKAAVRTWEKRRLGGGQLSGGLKRDSRGVPLGALGKPIDELGFAGQVAVSAGQKWLARKEAEENAARQNKLREGDGVLCGEAWEDRE